MFSVNVDRYFKWEEGFHGQSNGKEGRRAIRRERVEIERGPPHHEVPRNCYKHIEFTSPVSSEASLSEINRLLTCWRFSKSFGLPTSLATSSWRSKMSFSAQSITYCFEKNKTDGYFRLLIDCREFASCALGPFRGRVRFLVFRKSGLSVELSAITPVFIRSNNGCKFLKSASQSQI